jgi:hypothetical protein
MAIVKVPNFGITSATSTVSTLQTTTSTSYTDLSTVGPAVTLVTGNKALVIISCEVTGSTASVESMASFAVSGATTVAAADAVKLLHTNNLYERQSVVNCLTTLNSGSNTFTMKYRCNTGTGTFLNRQITVIDLGA